FHCQGPAVVSAYRFFDAFGSSQSQLYHSFLVYITYDLVYSAGTLLCLIELRIMLPDIFRFQEEGNEFVARGLMIYIIGLLAKVVLLAHLIIKMRDHALFNIDRLPRIYHFVMFVFE